MAAPRRPDNDNAAPGVSGYLKDLGRDWTTAFRWSLFPLTNPLRYSLAVFILAIFGGLYVLGPLTLFGVVEAASLQWPPAAWVALWLYFAGATALGILLLRARSRRRATAPLQR